ncbi:aminopeptidase 2 [Cordyceps fumosorosea ARSEF 2679]|uniref:gluconokinase n=1 Tax=Cordyceps fumosorosea (strain ARSEF 2679) TaxID=1081104 RepID=A0A168B6D0_CORFA|nr:aminopeptidase 2 [Cordyceps fumosorosea ARSEF 2679]OAA69681.1 aminopeptidase 2 [Cordyceps fumosorosea ARSEF 2679]
MTASSAPLQHGAVLVVCGAAASGKSSVAQALADEYGFQYIEGDNHHPQSSIDKMSSGIPLSDDDRWDWLARLRELAKKDLLAGHRGVVISCSALKQAYRDVIRVISDDRAGVLLRFVYLKVSPEVLLARIKARSGHFMKDSMLKSQLESLQEPLVAETDVITVDADAGLSDVTKSVISSVRVSVNVPFHLLSSPSGYWQACLGGEPGAGMHPFASSPHDAWAVALLSSSTKQNRSLTARVATMATLTLNNVDNRVQGRLALVTGASGGIGSGCAKGLAADGCDVALHYSSSKGKADALASELQAQYPTQLFVTISADLTSREATRALVANVLALPAVAQRGHAAVSILVANAGLGRRIRDVADIGEDDWDELMEVNARSQFVVTKTALQGMRAQGWGRVVLVGSIASHGGGINGCHYAASKGALCSMGKNLATVLAPEGITVNIVSPAMIGATGMIPDPKSRTWIKGTDIDVLKEQDPGLGIAASVPIHRLGLPEEVASVVSIDSTGSPGTPPCQRCIEEKRECVLATSKRGGRRVRKKKPFEESGAGAVTGPSGNPMAVGSLQTPVRQTAPRDGMDAWPHGAAAVAGPQPQQDPSWTGDGSASRTDASQSASRRSSVALDGHLAAADLLNPSDALDLLAQVADLDPGSQDKDAMPVRAANARQTPRDTNLRYPPISDGALGFADAAALIQHYHENFHPFFPIVYKSIFDGHISDWIEKEPYVLTAVLTVASKEEPSWQRAHEACSRHMESLLSPLIYGGVTTVGAVEALLILAEWAPQPPHEISSIGCGKEDYGAWMLVGVAIRLGYLQRLEQTGLQEPPETPSESFSRKKIAWAACYMSDRQVSIRLGKGFWSRGPGPASNLRAVDFPSLHTQQLGPDNMGLLLQAQLELTQLFSNAHDILYSSTSHREQLYVGGEYVRYIDDFAAVLRKWKMTWGSYSFTPHVKASLILSYDFLRLYINAFAFQATMNRAAAKTRKNKGHVTGPLFADLAAAPDARFIYESIDAANSLLSILNSFIDPIAGLKYMPLKYSLFVIYAAVFLFKKQAWSAGAISNEGITGVRRAILGTISQLQKTSSSTQSIGHRYARSLRLLWRKRPSRRGVKQDNNQPAQPAANIPLEQSIPGPQGGFDSGLQGSIELDALNGFSWRDLDSLGQYISNDASIANDGVLTTPEFDSEHSANPVEGLPVDFAYQNMWSGAFFSNATPVPDWQRCGVQEQSRHGFRGSKQLDAVAAGGDEGDAVGDIAGVVDVAGQDLQAGSWCWLLSSGSAAATGISTLPPLWAPRSWGTSVSGVVHGGVKEDPTKNRELLPANVVPTHYDLTLEPDLINFKYDGTVIVDLDVAEDSSSISLHTLEITIHSSKITSNGELVSDNASVTTDEKKQVTKFDFPGTLAKGSKAQLEIKFTGILNDKMAGFYRSTYKNKDGSEGVLAVSQMEPTDARRAFPCFDEPSLKAKFTVHIVAEKHLTCLSNMDVKNETEVGAKKTVHFNTSPLMSTYLLAFVVGELNYIETTAHRVPIRVYAPPSEDIEHGRFSLDLAAKTLPFYEKTFGIDFPLPKMDQVAIPDFSAGAMENWGLVTYRVVDLLLDEKETSINTKIRVAEVVQHELAHQWFGNLVTMDWWDGLWLNEGFATWVSWYSSNSFFPEWKVWEEYVVDNLQSALGLDSLRSSHPIEVPVKCAEEIAQIFDSISYSKGSAVLRMISTYLGEENFLEGVRQYLKKHAYGNTETGDLWASLAAASGKPVSEVMGVWTKEMGFPVVTVTENGSTAEVTQNRFLRTGDVKAEEDKVLYPVFLGLRTKDGVENSATLNDRTTKFNIPADDFFKLNANHTSLYRTAYSPERLRKLGEAAKAGLLTVEDRAGMIADAASLAVAGSQKTSGILNLLKGFDSETEYVVWSEILRRLSGIEAAWIFEDKAIRDGLRKFRRELVSPKAHSLGWEFKETDTHNEEQFKTLMFASAGGSGDEKIIQAAKDMFAKYATGDKSAIHPNLRASVFTLALKHGGSKEFDQIIDIYRASTITSERNTILRCLGRAEDPELIKRSLGMVFGPDIKNQDCTSALGGFRAYPHGIEAVFEYMTGNWDLIVKNVGDNASLIGGVVAVAAGGATKAEQLSKIEAFFADKNTSAFDQTLNQVKDSIRARIAWLERDGADVEAWVKDNGYLS